MTDKTMLKKPPNFVLVSPKSSTYPRGYASGFGSPAVALDDLFEHRHREALRPDQYPLGQ